MKMIPFKNYILLAVLIVFFSEPAEAYIDPATGSMAMQILLGGLAAAYLFLRERVNAFFYTIKRIFFGNKD